MSAVKASIARAQIREDVKVAWAGVTKVHDGIPRTFQASLPYAVVRLAEVARGDEGTIGRVEQIYRFEIVGVFRWPTSAIIENEKEARANELINRLMVGPIYAGEFYLPSIDSVRFEEIDDPKEPKYEVVVEFSLRVQVPALV